MVHYTRIIAALQKHVKNDIMPKIAGSVNGLLVFVVTGVIAERCEGMFRALAQKPEVAAMRVITGENVDADLLLRHTNAYMAEYESVSIDIPAINLSITLRAPDVAMIEKYIKEG